MLKIQLISGIQLHWDGDNPWEVLDYIYDHDRDLYQKIARIGS